MARIRTVKPDHWLDKGLSDISLQAHLLWIGTWNFSDDHGVFENDPILLRSQIFPRRTDIRTEQIVTWLDQLAKARYIIPFDYQKSGYYISRTFNTHQRIDKPTPSKVPDTFLRTILERSANPREDSALYSSVEESRVVEGREVDKPPAPKFVKPDSDQLTSYFEELQIDFFSAQGQSQKFLDYYNSNGWKVGKNPMRDWKAAARNWKERIKDFKKPQHAASQQSVTGNSKTAGVNHLLSKGAALFNSGGE